MCVFRVQRYTILIVNITLTVSRMQMLDILAIDLTEGRDDTFIDKMKGKLNNILNFVNLIYSLFGLKFRRSCKYIIVVAPYSILGVNHDQ